jgi:hypothetical protein
LGPLRRNCNIFIEITSPAVECGAINHAKRVIAPNFIF